jgi:hypothetical protein
MITGKRLGAAALAATTETVLVTAAAATQVRLVVFCNRSATDTTVRLSMSQDGAATANADYLLYDTTLPGNGYVIFNVPVEMENTDVLRAYAGAATVSVSAFGVERS